MNEFANEFAGSFNSARLPNSTLPSLEWKEEFRLAALPSDVRQAFASGARAWPLAVQRAIASGLTNLNDLTDMVFFMHHPARLKAGVGMPLSKYDPSFSKLASEWRAWQRSIKPMLQTPTPNAPVTGTQPGTGLRYGIMNGRIFSPFDAHRSTKNYTGYHLGIDVAPYTGKIKGVDDPRRGLPVYLTPKLSLSKQELDNTKIALRKEGPITRGLNVPSHGNALLEKAQVIRRGILEDKKIAYGAYVSIACIYTYPKPDGATGRLKFYIQYLHLITKDALPMINNSGTIVTMTEWIAAGKINKMGFGPRMAVNNVFSRQELVAASVPPLIGYMGATPAPHVHIQVAFSHEIAKKQIRIPFVDPTVVIN